jgi:hypothetical protein
VYFSSKVTFYWSSKIFEENEEIVDLLLKILDNIWIVVFRIVKDFELKEIGKKFIGIVIGLDHITLNILPLHHLQDLSDLTLQFTLIN